MLDRLRDWNGMKLPTRVVRVFDNYGVASVNEARELLAQFDRGERVINFGKVCAEMLRKELAA